MVLEVWKKRFLNAVDGDILDKFWVSFLNFSCGETRVSLNKSLEKFPSTFRYFMRPTRAGFVGRCLVASTHLEVV